VGNTTNGVQGVLGHLDVENGNGQSVVTVNGAADTIGRTATLSFTNFIGTIGGLAPAPITYATFSVSPLTVEGGSGGNVFNVQSTPAGFTTNILAGAGNDTVNVGNTANSLDGIQGPLFLNGEGGFNVLNINDQGSTGHSITVTSSTVQRSGAALITYVNFQNLNVHPGKPSGPSGTLDVESTDAKTPVTIELSGGATIDVGNAASSLDDLEGALTIDGQGGPVDLIVNDAGTATGQEFTLAQASVTRTGAAPITYAGIQDVVVNGGSGDNNVFDSDGVSAGTPATVTMGLGSNDLVRMRQHNLINDALTLHGQGMGPQLGYVAYTKDVYANLRTGQGTDLAGFSGIHDITGGQGHNILVGDGSEDTINGNLATGSAGRNLIISGGGSGTLYGSANGDVLIGGTTDYDLNQTALEAILAEWTRTDLSYRSIVEHLVNGDDPADPYPLNATTVHDSGAQNTLVGHPNGAQGLNLYYVTNADTYDATSDAVINVDGGGHQPRGTDLPGNSTSLTPAVDRLRTPVSETDRSQAAGQSVGLGSDDMIAALATLPAPQTGAPGQALTSGLPGSGDVDLLSLADLSVLR
jgi:hypothetical protein